MSQEVGVTEHVLLIDHKAKECKVWIINFKCHLLLRWSPDRAEAIVIWKRPKLVTDACALPPRGKTASAVSASIPPQSSKFNLHPHPGLKSPEELSFVISFPASNPAAGQPSVSTGTCCHLTHLTSWDRRMEGGQV